MGSFSTDRSVMLNSLAGYTDVLRRRKDALVAVQSVSGELLEKLISGDMQGLGEVLDRRESACKKLARVMSGTPELSSIVRRAQSAVSKGCEEPASSIVGLDEDIRSILADVVEKQRKCEELLKADIARTAEELRLSANRRRLNSTYGPANARPEARFVDRMR